MRTFKVQPQMVEKYEVSADKLTWTFTLRDGLEWHDGKPVTAEDCVASIRRWGARDGFGQLLMARDRPSSSRSMRKTLRLMPQGAVRAWCSRRWASRPRTCPS